MPPIYCPRSQSSKIMNIPITLLSASLLLSGCVTVKIDPHAKHRLRTIANLAIVQPLADVTRYEYPGDMGSEAGSMLVEPIVNCLRSSLEGDFNLFPMGMIPEDRLRGIMNDVRYLRNLLIKTKNTRGIKADHFLWEYLRNKNQDYLLVTYMEGFSRSRENFEALMNEAVKEASRRSTYRKPIQYGFTLTALIFDGKTGEVLYFVHARSHPEPLLAPGEDPFENKAVEGRVGKVLEDLLNIKRNQE